MEVERSAVVLGEKTVHLLAVISVLWNEKVQWLIMLESGFLILLPSQKESSSTCSNVHAVLVGQ